MSTKVIFRKAYYKDTKETEIVAVFPTMAGDMNPYTTCAGYIHVGQHTTLSLEWVSETKPATPEEYADLLHELTVMVGYDDLKIAKKMTRKDFLERKAQTSR